MSCWLLCDGSYQHTIQEFTGLNKRNAGRLTADSVIDASLCCGTSAWAGDAAPFDMDLVSLCSTVFKHRGSMGRQEHIHSSFSHIYVNLRYWVT